MGERGASRTLPSLDSLQNKAPSLRRCREHGSALVGQTLIGPARDDAVDGHEDAVVEAERVATDIGEDAEVLHLGQRVLDNDADAGEGRIVQLLLRRERVGLTRLVGQGDAALRRVVLQPLEAAIAHEREGGGSPRGLRTGAAGSGHGPTPGPRG